MSPYGMPIIALGVVPVVSSQNGGTFPHAASVRWERVGLLMMTDETLRWTQNERALTQNEWLPQDPRVFASPREGTPKQPMQAIPPQQQVPPGASAHP